MAPVSVRFGSVQFRFRTFKTDSDILFEGSVLVPVPVLKVWCRSDEFSREPSDFALEGDEDEQSIEAISRM
ncbi:hypothetical protein LWI28_006924 [Acer negundo]|uniref:Uncharacterized protein n=1 Tax=Acer negundo TaxID=4023 RepID=A0AAD5ITQ4_ACENE|nr:hypothetical protein LWI28_006924 [Acer negundo]